MRNLPDRAEILLSCLSGVGLGMAGALWGPLLVAVSLAHDPIHSGPYMETMLGLLVILPLGAGSGLALLSARHVRYRGERLVTWLGLISLLHSVVFGWLFLMS